MSTWKAIVVKGKDEIAVGTTAAKEPGKGQIRIKVKAVAINPADWKIALFAPAGSVLGLDGAGVVEKAGEEVKDAKVGDRVVFYSTSMSAMAEYYVVDSYKVAHMPDELSFANAAALPCAAMTAYVALHNKLHYQHGQSILITGGAGGVGGAAIQMAHQHGLKVITTASAKNADALKKLGANHVIDYSTQDVVAEVKKLTDGEGVDLALDCVGPESANVCLSCLTTKGGELATLGGNPTKPFPTQMMGCMSLHQVFVGYEFANDKKHKQQLEFVDHLHHLCKNVAHHKFQARVVSEIKFDEIPKGIATVKQGHTPGKIVALVDADQGVVKAYEKPEHKKPHDDKHAEKEKQAAADKDNKK